MIAEGMMKAGQLDLFTIEFDQEVEPQNQPEKPRAKRESQQAFDLEDVLLSPVIAWPSPWQADIPGDVLRNIAIARMAALVKGEEIATIPEAIAYLMPRSLSAPMDREWTNIYLFVCREYLECYKGVNSEAVDFAPLELTDYESGLLMRLRRKIYETRREVLKGRNRARRQAEKKAVGVGDAGEEFDFHVKTRED